MVGLLAPILIAAGVAWLRAGSVAGLRHLRIYWWPGAVAAIGVQLILYNPPVDQWPSALTFGPPVWILSLAAILAVVVRNVFQQGPIRFAFMLAAFGLGLNLVVVMANGGYMPQSAEARLAVRGTVLPSTANEMHLHNVAPTGPDTRLAWLGDVIPQPSWVPKANVISIGDALLALGMAGLVLITIASGPHQRRKLADS